tara:strand:+ start:6160 stop:6606 length:447 start_codon:yes stop_codon:yes gene_type:complete
MANAKIGSYPSHGLQVVEKIDSAKQLTRSDSGKLFFVEQAGSTYVINLPELSTNMAGWQAKFICSAIDGSVELNGYGVVAGGGTTGDNDVMRFVEIGHTEATTADVDGISFGASATTVGATIEIYTDGTYWFAYGFGAIANDIVAVDA